MTNKERIVALLNRHTEPMTTAQIGERLKIAYPISGELSDLADTKQIKKVARGKYCAIQSTTPRVTGVNGTTHKRTPAAVATGVSCFVDQEGLHVTIPWSNLITDGNSLRVKIGQ